MHINNVIYFNNEFINGILIKNVLNKLWLIVLVNPRAEKRNKAKWLEVDKYKDRYKEGFLRRVGWEEEELEWHEVVVDNSITEFELVGD